MYWKLAWRNLWRNHRRTIITLTSVMLAVVLATTMRCLQLGTYDTMINNVVGYYTGYLQLQGDDYWDTRSIDKGFTFDESLQQHLRSIRHIKSFTPRLEAYVLASSDDKTKSAMVVGTDPAMEDSVTQLGGKLIDGRYFSATDRSVMIAEGLADVLKLHTGDTVVVLGQGYHGANAAGKYPISGIVRFGAPELNKGMIYLPLKEAQWLFGGDVVTSVVMMLDNRNGIDEARHAIENGLPEGLTVMDWKEMMPDLVQAIRADNSGGLIMAGVLYLIIAFGLFGTFLMMLAERQHEFGILISIGMRHISIVRMVLLEILLIGVIGTAAGFALSVPVVYWLHENPIRFTGDAAQSFAAYGFEPVMRASLDPSIFTAQAELVLCITLLLALYPLARILKLNALKATRS
ncbi:MAG: ABC transporter permease [Flavobacteriales bacterium]|nr:ABC transporter permease [Flavobacteriales bacterium]